MDECEYCGYDPCICYEDDNDDDDWEPRDYDEDDEW